MEAAEPRDTRELRVTIRSLPAATSSGIANFSRSDGCVEERDRVVCLIAAAELDAASGWGKVETSVGSQMNRYLCDHKTHGRRHSHAGLGLAAA